MSDTPAPAPPPSSGRPATAIHPTVFWSGRPNALLVREVSDLGPRLPRTWAAARGADAGVAGLARLAGHRRVTSPAPRSAGAAGTPPTRGRRAASPGNATNSASRSPRVVRPGERPLSAVPGRARPAGRPRVTPRGPWHTAAPCCSSCTPAGPPGRPNRRSTPSSPRWTGSSTNSPCPAASGSSRPRRRSGGRAPRPRGVEGFREDNVWRLRRVE
ncbi:hypothetical protein LV779_26365 [Streptomyces thinghirensis]|nr:hypothetical protein [Streptomyces thinghirensis]